MLRDITIENDSDATRTRKILDGLESACNVFDLSVPIWLESNISDFKRVSKTRFTSDSFIEPVDFSYLEIQIIEEDDR